MHSSLSTFKEYPPVLPPHHTFIPLLWTPSLFQRNGKGPLRTRLGYKHHHRGRGTGLKIQLKRKSRLPSQSLQLPHLSRRNPPLSPPANQPDHANEAHALYVAPTSALNPRVFPPMKEKNIPILPCKNRIGWRWRRTKRPASVSPREECCRRRHSSRCRPSR